MPKVEEDTPLDQNFAVLTAAIEAALAKAALALDQLKVARSTLQASASSLAEVDSSEEARAECSMNFIVSQMLATRAVSNLWEAADSTNEALGLEVEEDDDEEEG
jgi:hypothetical protein